MVPEKVEPPAGLTYVDPEEGQITVLALGGAAYTVHGKFGRGEQATSTLLPAFGADVTAALAAKR